MSRGEDTRPIATLRHVSASGKLDAYWEYDPARRLLMGQVARASAPPIVLPDDVEDDARVRLTTDRDGRREPGSFVVVRKGAGDVFMVMPARFRRDETLETVSIHRSLPVGPIALTCAPEDVAADLLALFEPPPPPAPKPR